MINCNNALISTNNIGPIYVLLLWAALHSGDEISHSRVFITQLRNPNLERVVVKYVLEKEEICCTKFCPFNYISLTLRVTVPIPPSSSFL